LKETLHTSYACKSTFNQLESNFARNKLTMHTSNLTTKVLIVLLVGIPFLVSAQLSPIDAISQMKKGINLGNTLEPPREGEWGNPPTQ